MLESGKGCDTCSQASDGARQRQGGLQGGGVSLLLLMRFKRGGGVRWLQHYAVVPVSPHAPAKAKQKHSNKNNISISLLNQLREKHNIAFKPPPCPPPPDTLPSRVIELPWQAPASTSTLPREHAARRLMRPTTSRLLPMPMLMLLLLLLLTMTMMALGGQVATGI